MTNHRPVFSFDVFDTCLLRLCGEPRNLFEILSKKVLDLMGVGNEGEHLRKVFVSLRSEAEGMTLTDIYAEVEKEFRLPCSIEEMARLEMQTEAEMLRPIKKTLLLVEQLRKDGDIIFISDMYLPDNFIREQLVVAGFFREGDRLYVSNTVGAWKSDGSLYKMICEREGISFRHWHHYGDNRNSDFKLPKKMGIDAHWIHYDYLPYEQQWADSILTTGFQYPSIMAGVSRAVRLTSSSPLCQANFVADISAPVMTAWVYGVLRDAQQRGIQRVFFQARDTHSYYLLARKLQPLFPNIELKYLYLSRQSLYNNNPLRIKYFEQEGLASRDRVAIVDVTTSGKTLRVINQLLLQNGYPAIDKSYCFFGLWKPDFSAKGDDELDQMMAENRSIEYCAFEHYIKAVGKGMLKRLTDPIVFVESLFSLNYHARTVDYCQRGNIIRPVMEPDTETPWTFRDRDERKMKKSNDTLLQCFVNVMQTVKLMEYSPQILERIAIPTLVSFIYDPQKDYLEYLHLFQFGGVSYVEKRWKKHVWKRGSTVYTLPTPCMRLIDQVKRKTRRSCFNV